MRQEMLNAMRGEPKQKWPGSKNIKVELDMLLNIKPNKKGSGLESKMFECSHI